MFGNGYYHGRLRILGRVSVLHRAPDHYLCHIRHSNRRGRITAIVEKPRPADAPSNLAVVGRYVLSPRIFDLLEATRPGAGGEIQLTDAISALLAEQSVLAYHFQGTRFDCGTHIGLIEATIRHALDHEKLSEAAQGFMREALVELGVVDS